MHKTAHQAALEQARLLATYLAETPTTSLDLYFIRRHLDALDSFAQASQIDSAVVVWQERTPEAVPSDSTASTPS